MPSDVSRKSLVSESLSFNFKVKGKPRLSLCQRVFGHVFAGILLYGLSLSEA